MSSFLFVSILLLFLSIALSVIYINAITDKRKNAANRKKEKEINNKLIESVRIDTANKEEAEYRLIVLTQWQAELKYKIESIKMEIRKEIALQENAILHRYTTNSGTISNQPKDIRIMMENEIEKMEKAGNDKINELTLPLAKEVNTLNRYIEKPLSPDAIASIFIYMTGKDIVKSLSSEFPHWHDWRIYPSDYLLNHRVEGSEWRYLNLGSTDSRYQYTQCYKRSVFQVSIDSYDQTKGNLHTVSIDISRNTRMSDSVSNIDSTIKKIIDMFNKSDATITETGVWQYSDYPTDASPMIGDWSKEKIKSYMEIIKTSDEISKMVKQTNYYIEKINRMLNIDN